MKIVKKDLLFKWTKSKDIPYAKLHFYSFKRDMHGSIGWGVNNMRLKQLNQELNFDNK